VTTVGLARTGVARVVVPGVALARLPLRPRGLVAALAWFALAAALAACSRHRHLRGSESPSPDGKTYLAVDDLPFAGCALFLDKRPWPHPARAAGPITPGEHLLECRDAASVPGESAAGFVVTAGTVFHFDYWGP
jgi:hypothetical protein